jgi:hypothetical protein
MRYFLLVIIFLTATTCFAQKSKKKQERLHAQQNEINRQLDSLQYAGALEKDSASLSGEKIDSFAEYPGGDQGWRVYLEKSYVMKVLNQAVDMGIPEGMYTVWVEMIIHEDGSVSDIKPLTAFGYGLEKGSVRIIRESGQWIPATANGKKVASKHKRRVLYRISSE